MKRKKIMAALLASVMALGVFAAPAAALQADAAPDWSKNWNNVRVYTANFADGITVNMQTPQTTVKLYAGLSWEALESDIGVRMNVTDSECGAAARQAFQGVAASLGAGIVRILDMDLEKYIQKRGWTEDVVTVNSPIRVCITLPKGSDLTKDYAVISVRGDGALEVLGDLDLAPSTITVDSANFDTFVIIAGMPGAFNAYKIGSPYAIDQVWLSNYTKKVGTTIGAASKADKMYAIGMVTDLATVRNVVGDQIVTLEVSGAQPGPLAKSVLQYAASQTFARGITYYEVELRNGKREQVIRTNQKLRITMTAPYDFPAYADYAVAVLNEDGSVSVLKDIDANDSTITIDTDQFRSYAILWGTKGAFALLP